MVATGQLSLSLFLSVLPSLARPTQCREWQWVPAGQDSGLLQSTPPADSQLVVIVCRCPDLAISSVCPALCSALLSITPNDWRDPLSLLFFSSFFRSLCLYLISAALPVSNPHLDLLLLIGFRCLWRWRERRKCVCVGGGKGRGWRGEARRGEDFTPPSPLIKKMITQNTKIKDENRKCQGR